MGKLRSYAWITILGILMTLFSPALLIQSIALGLIKGLQNQTL